MWPPYDLALHRKSEVGSPTVSEKQVRDVMSPGRAELGGATSG